MQPGPFRDRKAKTFFAVHPGVQLYPRVDIQDNIDIIYMYKVTCYDSLVKMTI